MLLVEEAALRTSALFLRMKIVRAGAVHPPKERGHGVKHRPDHTEKRVVLVPNPVAEASLRLNSHLFVWTIFQDSFKL